MNRMLRRLLPAAVAILSAAVPACGSDTCDDISIPHSAEVAKGDDGELRFSVRAGDLGTHHQPVLALRVLGPKKGLRAWYAPSDSGRSQCESNPASADNHCSVLVDVVAGQSYTLGLHGSTTGEYELEGRLVDYAGIESLQDPPLCTTSTHVKVR
jgi:hypothetical protein